MLSLSLVFDGIPGMYNVKASLYRISAVTLTFCLYLQAHLPDMLMSVMVWNAPRFVVQSAVVTLDMYSKGKVSRRQLMKDIV